MYEKPQHIYFFESLVETPQTHRVLAYLLQTLTIWKQPRHSSSNKVSKLPLMEDGGDSTCKGYDSVQEHHLKNSEFRINPIQEFSGNTWY